MNAKMTNTRPAYVARVGAVRASVWAHVHDRWPRYKVTLTRLYQHESTWHRSRTFYATELPAVAAALAQAQAWVRAQTRWQKLPQNRPASQSA